MSAPVITSPPQDPRAYTRWWRLLLSWGDAAVLAVWIMVWLQMVRLFMLYWVRAGIGSEATVWTVVQGCLQGMRFDGKVAVLFSAPLILLGLVQLAVALPRLQRGLRIGLGVAWVALTVLITIIDLAYWQEYHNQFDHFLVGAITDDQAAIASTVWRSYPVVSVSLLWAALTVAGSGGWWWLQRCYRQRVQQWKISSPVWLSVFTLIGVLVVIGGLRGKLSGGRPFTFKEAAVTTDTTVNRLVPNPYSALSNAWSDVQRALNGSGSLTTFLPDGNIRAASARRFGTPIAASLEQSTKRIAHGTVDRPNHVVLIIGESMSGWFLADRYRSVGLGDEVRLLADRGFHVANFISETEATIGSFSTIITGMPNGGTPINLQTSARIPYATSLAPIFSRLGYRTRLHYAGYLSWQRIGDFSRNQGFDEVYGAESLPTIHGSQWGAADRDVFNAVLTHLDPNVPSLDVILTVSNHSPFEIDVVNEGWTRVTMPDDLAAMDDGTADWYALGHAWYADQCIGEFAQAAMEKLGPGLCLAMTGDHYGRRFLNRRPTLWEEKAVPFIALGAGFRQPMATDQVAGAHLDILPTLIERCAPAGFIYHAWGRDLRVPNQDAVSYGVQASIDVKGVMDLAISPITRADQREMIIQRQRDYNDQRALAWWWIMNGPTLPQAAPIVSALVRAPGNLPHDAIGDRNPVVGP